MSLSPHSYCILVVTSALLPLPILHTTLLWIGGPSSTLVSSFHIILSLLLDVVGLSLHCLRPLLCSGCRCLFNLLLCSPLVLWIVLGSVIGIGCLAGWKRGETSFLLAFVWFLVASRLVCSILSSLESLAKRSLALVLLCRKNRRLLFRISLWESGLTCRFGRPLNACEESI